MNAKPRIAPLRQGEELIDAATFAAFHSRDPRDLSALESRTFAPASDGERRRAARRIPDLAELGARPLPAPSAPRPPASAAATAALEAEIDRSADRDRAGRLAVHLAHAYAAGAALFVVHHGLVQGAWSAGLPADGGAVLFPADCDGVLARVARTGEPFRGEPPRHGLDGRVLRVLGRAHVRHVAVLPVKIGARTVGLLYADNGPEVLGDASLAALESICTRLGRAYARLILARRAC